MRMDFSGFEGYTNLEEQRWKVGQHQLWKTKCLSEELDLRRGTTIDNSAMIYGYDLMNIGENVYIGPMVYMRGRIKIGDMTWVGIGAQINGEGECDIGKGVGIGNNVIILTCEHDQPDLQRPISFGELARRKVVIEDGANIGVGAIILPGVTIGEGAQIGAGAVVTRNVPTLEIWAGNPAVKIGTRESYK